MEKLVGVSWLVFCRFWVAMCGLADALPDHNCEAIVLIFLISKIMFFACFFFGCWLAFIVLHVFWQFSYFLSSYLISSYLKKIFCMVLGPIGYEHIFCFLLLPLLFLLHSRGHEMFHDDLIIIMNKWSTACHSHDDQICEFPYFLPYYHLTKWILVNMRWSRSRCRSRSSGLIVGRMRRELHIQHPLSLTTHTQWWWWRAVQSDLEFCYNSRVPDLKNIWHHNWNALGGLRHMRPERICLPYFEQSPLSFGLWFSYQSQFS